MKSIALANRLCRDFDVKSFSDLTVDARLEILDAINGTLQTVHDLAANENKTTFASLPTRAPQPITLTVTNGSRDISGHAFVADDYYCTIQIEGDRVDNQIIGSADLLHPYAGESGDVTAVIYSDAVQLPEPYVELVGHPRIIETNHYLYQYKSSIRHNRATGRPDSYWVEPNAINQSAAIPAIFRIHPMPDSVYRLECRVTLAPLRVTFSDLLTGGGLELPVRTEHIEAYLLPIARGALTHSRHWKNADDIGPTRDAAKIAKDTYEKLVPRSLSTPSRRARTKFGY